MKLASFAVLVAGVFLGGVSTAFFLDAYTPLLKNGALTSSVVLAKEADPIAASTTPLVSTVTLPVPPSPVATSSHALHIPVIVYHSVRPYIKGEPKEQDIYDITPELLDQELAYVEANGFHTVTFKEIALYLDQGTPLPEKPVVLSFDDGWKNQYIYAFPILRKYGAKATFFIFSNPMDHKNPEWMSWDDLRELEAAGMEIGGHTKTHPMLEKLSDLELENEIAGGKRSIEESLGHPIVSFAYPFGITDERIIAEVKHSGFSVARTLNAGVWDDPAHPFELHGILATDHIADFERWLNKP